MMILKKWWNKPWTNGTYVKLSLGVILITLVYAIGVILKTKLDLKVTEKVDEDLKAEKDNIMESTGVER